MTVAFFILGAIVASFVGVLSERLHTGQDFLAGRSRCDACDKPLLFASLVPIFSFFALRGRAVCCGASISWRAPATEIILGGLFVSAYLNLGLTSALPFFLLSLSALLALVLYDLNHQILPQFLLGIFIISSVAVSAIISPSITAFFYALITPALIAMSLFLIYFFSGGRAMGFSDAPLAFGLSVLVGQAAFPGFIFSFWIGAVVGIALLLKRSRGSRMGVEVPFAPFMAAGFLLAYFTQWNPFVLIAVLP